VVLKLGDCSRPTINSIALISSEILLRNWVKEEKVICIKRNLSVTGGWNRSNAMDGYVEEERAKDWPLQTPDSRGILCDVAPLTTTL